MATNNDGSTKAKAIVDKAETVTVDATKVTDLSISRAGKVYTATWKNASTYSSIKIKYRLKKDGNWYPWTNYVTLGSSDTSKAFVTINYSDYHPYIPTYLRMMEVGVLVDQANKVETVYEKKKNKKGKIEWHKHTKTTKYTSKLATCTYDLWDPKKPRLSVTDGSSETTFTLKVPESNTDGNNVTTKITRWTKSIENWGTKDPSTNYDWANKTEYNSTTGKYSSDTRTFTHTLGAADVAQGKSYTVMAKAVAQGPNGDPTTTYSSIVYAYPKAASNIKVSAVNSGSTQYKVTISWDKNEDSTHPCKRYKIQYYIGTPANTSMGIPSSGVSWTNATEYINCQSGVKQTTTIFTPRIGDEQCLWVRVIQNNVQTMETPSKAVLVKSFSTLVAPTIESITYDAVTQLLTVSVDSNTNLDGVVSYVYIGKDVYTVPASGVLSVTRAFSVISFSWAINARNYFGSVASSTTTQYFDPSRDASNPTPYVPTGLSASKIGTTGNIKLTWTPVLKGVTSSRITVADNSEEWSYASPDFIQDITIEGSATSAVINELELGASYYFRVQSTNSHGTTGYSAIYGPVKLSAADVPSPNISLQETADHGIRVSWNWNSWTSARGIQISWSTDKNDRDGSNPFEILKGLSAGAQTYTIPPLNLERGETWYVWAWFTSGNARSTPDEEHILLPISMSAPTNLSLSRAAQNTDEEGQTTARLTWRNNTSTENTTSIEVSWSDNPHAWETTSGAETYDSESIINTILIPELTLGKTWYARIRTIYNEKHYVWSAIASIDLRTTPSTPRISVSKNLVSQYSSVDFSWSYENEDLSEQASATVRIYNSSNVLVGNATVANSDKAVTVYCEQIGLVGDQDYYATVQTTSANGRSSDVSDEVHFTVVNVPIASITSTSLVDVIVEEDTENESVVKQLQELPLSVTVGGVPTNGTCIVYIERSKTIQLARPDESTSYGYEGELVVVAEGTNQVSITQEMLQTDFTDGGEYRIYAIALNQLGTRSDPATLDFTVAWTHQAIKPTATYVVDPDLYIAKITPIEPEEALETDTFDIYRLSADKPELIVQGGEWGTTYVDPYITLGDNAGHRVVMRTENGDYTTAENEIAWIDLIPPNGTEEPFIDNESAVIDFDGQQIEIEHNLDVTHSWEKDFTETKYLGGSIQGDWNPAVSRKASMGAVMIKLIEASDIIKMKRLAAYAGICHVRTPDGSSFTANVSVTEAWSTDKDWGFAEYTLDITRVDAETLDGMTLAEWEETHGVE